jgi:hypothetical protein
LAIHQQRPQGRHLHIFSREGLSTRLQYFTRLFFSLYHHRTDANNRLQLPYNPAPGLCFLFGRNKKLQPLRQHSRCVWQCSFLSTITERLFSSAIFSLSLHQLPPYRTDGQIHHIRNVTKADQARHRSCKKQDHSSTFQTKQHG